MFFVSKGVEEFCEAMVDNPQDWVQGQYEFVNMKHRDLAIWTCNGVFYIKIGRNACLNIFEKRYIQKTISRTMARKLKVIK